MPCESGKPRAKRAWLAWTKRDGTTLAHAVNLQTMRPYCGCRYRVPGRAVKAAAEVPTCGTCAKIARGTRRGHE